MKIFNYIFISIASVFAAAKDDKPTAQAGLFPKLPEESTKAAQVDSGFKVELFASEPHVASPVAFAFDADGDAYVAEMLDYPIIRTPGMFGPFPEGQIRLLRTDENGKVVKSSVFAGAIDCADERLALRRRRLGLGSARHIVLERHRRRRARRRPSNRFDRVRYESRLVSAEQLALGRQRLDLRAGSVIRRSIGATIPTGRSCQQRG